jgi:serine protease Do
VAKSVSPAVVNIRTESRQRAQELSEFFGGGSDNDLFEQFFGRPRGDREDPDSGSGSGSRRGRDQIVSAAGTGFIIDKSGLIITNNHVVEGASKIEVSLYGEDEDQQYQARIIGRDPLTDSALIELTEKVNHELPVVKFGDSAQMQPGDWVMAIGNPFGLEHTVSVGVISGIERPFEVAPQRSTQVLQTDAAINPGNSGGPLLNIRGEVIGINTAIISDARQASNIGIGFAIPSNVVRELLPQLRSGKVTRGRIGVQVRPVEREAIDEFGLKNRDGAVVAAVSDGGAAAKAGLELGDVIVGFNGKPVKSSDELVSMVTATRPGTTVPVRIVRDRQERTLSLTVDELDLEAESALRRGARATPEADTPQEPARGFGIRLNNITPDVERRFRLESGQQGAVIIEVEPDSAAARRGLAPGDVIFRVGSVPIQNAADAQRELTKVASGETAFLRVRRQGQELFITVTKD